MPLRSRNKPTDGTAVVAMNKPKKIRFKDPSYEVLIIIAELIREAPQGGVPKSVLVTNFLEPQSSETQRWLNSTLRMLKQKGIIVKAPKGNEKVELTRDGFYWARDQFARISLNPLPRTTSSKQTNVFPITRN